METKPIVLSDPRMLAEFMRESEFKAFFEKRFAVPPEFAALLFKNGQLIDAYKGGHFSVGGLVNQLKSIIGGSTHVSMLIADLKPFQMQTRIDAKSRDNVDLAGVVTLELQVNPDKPENILGMMHGVDRVPGDANELGRKALAKADVLARLRPHLSDRVFEATLGRMDASEIRGNIGLQDKVQAEIMKECERVLGDLGLMVRNASVEWAQNAEEAAEQARADALRQQDEIDFQIEMAKRQAERVNDTTVFELKSNLDLEKLKHASEEELRHMALNSEIEFIDAREAGKRRQELEEIDHQIAVLDKERKAAFNNSLANAKNAIEIKELEKRQLKIDLEMEAMRGSQIAEGVKSGLLTEIEIDGLRQKQQREHIAGLQEIELRGEKVRSEIKRLEAKEAAEQRLAELKLKGNLTPEQLLALDAGMSPNVAMVLVEQAKAAAAQSSDKEALMRELIEAAQAGQIRTETQAREMFKMGMDGAVGVAAGAGGGSAPAPAAAAQTEETMIECPKCSTPAKATARFCLKCGHKLRT